MQLFYTFEQNNISKYILNNKYSISILVFYVNIVMLYKALFIPHGSRPPPY